MYPLVSVVIRTAGRAELADALASLAAQTYQNIEIILVDVQGAGLLAWGDAGGRSPVRMVTKGQHLGRGAAANAGLDASRGAYAIFLDDDDWYLPDHIETLVTALASAEDAKASYAGIECRRQSTDGIWEVLRVFNEPYDATRLLLQNYLPIHAVLFERGLLGERLRFDESLRVYEDWDFWIQLSQLTRLLHVDKVTAIYRISDTSGFGIRQGDPESGPGYVALMEKWRQRWTPEQLVAIGGYPWQLAERVNEDARRQIKAHEDAIALLKQRLTELEAESEKTPDMPGRGVRSDARRARSTPVVHGFGVSGNDQRDLAAGLNALRTDPNAVAALRQLEELRVEVDRAGDAFGVLFDAERAAQAESRAALVAVVARLEGAASDRDAQVHALEQSMIEGETRITGLESDLAEREATIATLTATLEQTQDLQVRFADLKNRLLYRLHAINLSPAWQLGRPLRALEYRLPVLTQRAAAAAKLLWWGASLQLPSRLRLRRLANQLLESGEFALTWYVERYPDVVLSGFNPTLHWLVSGWREGRDPNPLFDSNWYLDEHPELRDAATNPFLHYLSEGAAAGWDPNPLFDTEAYVEASDGACDRVSALRHFAESSQPFAQGAYRSADVLADLQQAYRAETQTCLLRDERSHQKRYAVFLQCGVGSVHRAWLSENDKDWDLIVNHYDDTQRGAMACQVEFEQRGRRAGTKFTAIDAVLSGWPQFLARYDYLLLLDDDIELSEVDISRLFSTAAEQGLDLAQASLSPDSHGCHPVFQTTGRSGFRYVNGVEIMMPVMSRRALALAQPLFGQTISGWGLDVALAELVRARLDGRAAVVDEIVAKHCKPIDLSNGPYYRMLRQANIFPLLEYRLLRRAYAADAGFFEV